MAEKTSATWKLAAAIADDLFRRDSEMKVERLLLWSDSENKDFGGWSHGAVVDRIEAILTREEPTNAH